MREDLTGRKFGRLTVMDAAGRTCGGRYQWRCVCDCGKGKIAEGTNLKVGNTTSCGCYRLERIRVTHGHARKGKVSITHLVWQKVVSRCTNPNNPNFARYGARGIKVCDRWHIFEHFLEDMGERPSRKHSIDRVNNEGNYEPGNCRWATNVQQARNRRSSRFLEFNGKKATLAEWSEITNINAQTISRRVGKLGWSVEQALTETPSPYAKIARPKQANP